MSVQYFADASQKLTCPVVTEAVPTSTAAVRVTTVPVVTEVTALPLDLTVRLVTVEILFSAEASLQTPLNTATPARHSPIHLDGWVARRILRSKTTKTIKQQTNKRQETMAA
jgi:hypothetical protein